MLRNLQSSWANNARIVRIKKLTLFYMNNDKYGNFQIYISVPLKEMITEGMNTEKDSVTPESDIITLLLL